MITNKEHSGNLMLLNKDDVNAMFDNSDSVGDFRNKVSDAANRIRIADNDIKVGNDFRNIVDEIIWDLRKPEFRLLRNFKESVAEAAISDTDSLFGTINLAEADSPDDDIDAGLVKDGTAMYQRMLDFGIDESEAKAAIRDWVGSLGIGNDSEIFSLDTLEYDSDGLLPSESDSEAAQDGMATNFNPAQKATELLNKELGIIRNEIRDWYRIKAISNSVPIKVGDSVHGRIATEQDEIDWWDSFMGITDRDTGWVESDTSTHGYYHTVEVLPFGTFPNSLALGYASARWEARPVEHRQGEARHTMIPNGTVKDIPHETETVWDITIGSQPSLWQIREGDSNESLDYLLDTLRDFDEYPSSALILDYESKERQAEHLANPEYLDIQTDWRMNQPGMYAGSLITNDSDIESELMDTKGKIENLARLRQRNRLIAKGMSVDNLVPERFSYQHRQAATENFNSRLDELAKTWQTISIPKAKKPYQLAAIDKHVEVIDIVTEISKARRLASSQEKSLAKKTLLKAFAEQLGVDCFSVEDGLLVARHGDSIKVGFSSDGKIFLNTDGQFVEQAPPIKPSDAKGWFEDINRCYWQGIGKTRWEARQPKTQQSQQSGIGHFNTEFGNIETGIIWMYPKEHAEHAAKRREHLDAVKDGVPYWEAWCRKESACICRCDCKDKLYRMYRYTESVEGIRRTFVQEYALGKVKTESYTLPGWQLPESQITYNGKRQVKYYLDVESYRIDTATGFNTESKPIKDKEAIHRDYSRWVATYGEQFPQMGKALLDSLKKIYS